LPGAPLVVGEKQSLLSLSGAGEENKIATAISTASAFSCDPFGAPAGADGHPETISAPYPC
jgi:hypothetical protein